MAEAVGLCEAVSRCAVRLRLLQVDLADASARLRHDAMTDELERSLAKVMPADREAFVEALLERFPAWDRMVDVSASVQEAPAGTGRTDQSELNDLSFLLTRLGAIAGGLTAAQRQVALDRLAEMGLKAGGAAGGGLSESVVERLCGRLSLKPEEVDATRVAEALLVLAGFAVSMDQLSWRVWQSVGARSAIRRQSMLADVLRAQLSGGEGGEHLGAEVERLRELAASLVSSAGRIAQAVIRPLMNKLSPGAIDAAVKAEGGSLLTGAETRCWRKYIELCGALASEEAVTAATQSALRESVETLIAGSSGRGGR